MVRTINKALGSPVAEVILNGTFDALWPRLEEQLKAMPKAETAPPPKREVADMVAEILELSRSMVDVRNTLEQIRS